MLHRILLAHTAPHTAPPSPYVEDPGSRSCEDMVCKIQLPGTKAMRELDLDVQVGGGVNYKP